jgi:hypothetical protein
MNDPTQAEQPIETGVSESESLSNENQDHPLSERDKKRDEIVARRNAELRQTAAGESPTGEAVSHQNAADYYNSEAEIQSGVAIENQKEETPTNSPDSLGESGQPQEGPGEDEVQPYYLKDGIPTVALKVKGETIELPWERVKGIAQKNILAENRLRQAADAERNLVNREELVLQREQELESKSLTHLPEPSGVEHNVDLGPLLDETTTALFDGDKKDARATLEKLITAARQPTASRDPALTVQQIEKRATDTAISVLRQEKAAEQQELYKGQLRDGLAQLTEQFPEVMQDDVLFSMVDRRTQDIASEHPDWTPQQVMLSAGKDIQDRIGLMQKPTSVAEDPDRQARKEDLRVVPANRVSATQQPAPVSAPIDTSPAGVIARMKSDRGAIAGQN